MLNKYFGPIKAGDTFEKNIPVKYWEPGSSTPVNFNFVDFSGTFEVASTGYTITLSPGLIVIELSSAETTALGEGLHDLEVRITSSEGEQTWINGTLEIID